MNPQEIEDFKNKIEKDTIDNIVSKIEVNDSYFYATLVVTKSQDMVNIFEGPKVHVIIKMILHRSEHFSKPNVSNGIKILSKGKEIVSRFEIEESRLKDDTDAILFVYEEVGKQIAADLFQANAHELNYSYLNNHGRDVI